MFRELDDFEGERRTSYENNKSKTLQQGENSTKLRSKRLTSKCGNWNFTNPKKRERIYIALNTYNSHPVICKTIKQL